ncbi:MAG: hypothetical protein CMP23_09470 [Rickettsiales bacterium]|nr:hypothetical protein [Rickettsiales bacterium]
MISPPGDRIGPDPGRRRWPGFAQAGWLRASIVAVVLFSSSVGLVAAVGSEPVEERFRRALMHKASDLIGEDLYVRELRVEQVLPPALRLSGVTVHSRDQVRRGQPLLRIDEIELRFGNPLSLLSRRVDLSSVVLTRPAFRLAVEDGQLRDFAGLRELLKMSPGKQPVELWLGSLGLVDLSAHLTMEPLSLGAVVTGLNLEFRQDREGGGNGRLDVGGIELIAGELREQAQVASGTFSLERGVVSIDGYRLTMNSGQVALGGMVVLPQAEQPFSYSLSADASVDLPSLRSAWPRLPELEGALDARLQARGEGLEPEVSFSLQSRGVRLHVKKRKKRRFELGDSVLIGRFVGGDLLLSKESVLAWGGGQTRIGGRLALADELPFEAELDFRGLQFGQTLDAVAVKGAWVDFSASGVANLRGTLRGGLRGTGRGSVELADMRVWNGPWDEPKGRREILRVPALEVDTGLVLSERSCLLAPARVRARGSELRVSADLIYDAPIGLDIEVRSSELDLADMDRFIAGAHFEGRGGVEARIKGQAPNIEVSGSLEMADFQFGRWPFGRASADLRWRSRQDLEISNLRAQRGSSDYEAEMRLMFADLARGGSRERMELDLRVKVPRGHGRAEDLLPIFFADAVPLSGSLWGEAHLFGSADALSGAGWVSGEELDYLWERFASLDLRATLHDGSISIEHAFARKASGNGLFARGTIGADRKVAIEFRVPHLGLDELSPVQRAFPASRAGEGELGEGQLALLAGALHGGGVLGGSLDELEVHGQLKLKDTVYRGASLGDSKLDVAIEERQLSASGSLLGGQVLAAAEMQLRGIYPYRFTVDGPDIDLGPFLPRTVVGRREPVRAHAGGRLLGLGTLRDSYHDLSLELDRLQLDRGGHRMSARGGEQVVVRYADGSFRFEHLELVGPDQRTDLKVSGWVRPSGPLDVSVVGKLDAAFLDLAYDVFHRVEADALELALDIRGMSTGAVNIDGSAELREGLIKTIYFPHALEVDFARLTLRDRRLSLEDFRGALGGGRIEGAEGSHIVLDRTGYRPRSYNLRARCADCRIQYPSFMPPIRGDAELQFRGLAPSDLVLSGSVDVEDMVLREPLNWTRSLFTFRNSSTESLAADQGPALFAFDIDFNSRSEGLRIDNNLGDLWGTADRFHLGGDTNHVRLSGAVRLDGGRLPWKGREFNLDPGIARFGSGETWLPEVDLSMWTDVSTREETHRIRYSVSGPLDALQLTATASPYLSEADINSILLFGLTGEQLARANVGEVLAAAGGAGLGTLGETAATSVRASVDGGSRSGLPDRLEIVPVYSETTGSTTLWALVSKEVVPDLLTLEGGLGYAAGARAVDSVGRVQLRFLRNFYLEASWLRDSRASTDYGNFGLDVKLELDVD